MANKGALIVGTGSGGSEIALNLASTGIGHITLIDDDRIQPENYFRFIAGMSELGRFKIDAVRDSIIERELATSVSTFPLDIIKEADRLRGIVADFDGVLICATDSIASRRVMNCTAVLYQKPLVIAGTLDGGRIGEIMLVLPFQGPCYECVRLHFGTALEPGESDGRSPIPYLGNEDSRGGEAAGAALRSDIVVVAGLATRVALSVLDPEDFPTLSANYIAWGREECSGNPEPFNFALPFSTHYAAIPRTKDCPVCGAIPTELIGVNIEAKAADILSAVRAETP
jgi:molybdopterin/thiamine biosynthesis adenylyltransferase